MKEGSFIGIDDFSDPLQHGIKYELSLVDPFALYFAQANKLPCAKLGNGQFCIHVDRNKLFSFTNFVDNQGSNSYPDIISRIRKPMYSKKYILRRLIGMIKRTYTHHFVRVGSAGKI